MLIEFSVTNYRSIRETQTLSMAASRYYKGLEESNCFDPNVSGVPNLLRTAVIYGPNAGGKSNTMKAMQFMQAFVLVSHSYQEGQSINVSPFALSAETRTRPSEFELSFLRDGVRYQYGFAVTPVRVTKEWLLAYPEGKAQRWFERASDEKSDKENWYFGSKFVGRKQLWQEATRKNALFLSTAIQLNNEQLKPVFSWFQDTLDMILPKAAINLKFSLELCESEAGKARVMEFLESADLTISGIDVKKVRIPFSQSDLPLDMPPDMRDRIAHELQEKEVPLVFFQHPDDSGNLIPISFSDESDGTQKLFAFAGPCLDVFEKGRILFVDEMDTSLHPLLVRFLVENFHSTEANRNNAQLVFTTHDTSILDMDLFRRDQIWFVDKDRSSATKLYPLSDFSPRKGEAVEKWYLKGRYGALPFVGDLRH
ncbi:MAG: ATP-binding protein [Syntrophorhabdales bacterium]